jgi:ribonucleoside-triphosphate reductase
LNSTVAKPAKKALAAILHACKWISFAHSEFSGEQCYPLFNTFLAPYLKGLSYTEIKELAQTYIFENNQLILSQGSHIPVSSILCSSKIPKNLRTCDAIGPGGEITGVYGDFESENLHFFNALSEILSEGDGNGKILAFPKHKILIGNDDILEENTQSNLLKEAKIMGTPIFINKNTPWIKDNGYFGPFFTNSLKNIYEKEILGEEIFDWSNKFVNSGSLQSITINLPRIAYESKGNDEKLKEILLARMEIIKEILLIKYNLIKRLVENNSLPLCSSKIGSNPMLDLKSQALTFGIVGLNEMIKAHCNYQIHEDETALSLSKDLLSLIIAQCENYSRENEIFFTLWEQPTEFASFRFASLDLKHFSNASKGVLNGNTNTGAVYYTPSAMVNFSENIELDKKIGIHKEIAKIIQNNCSLPIWLGNSGTEGSISNFIKNLFEKEVNEFSLGYDFSYCPKCGSVVKDVIEKCQTCTSTEEKMRVISKITDYYSPLELWNPGKREEFKNRRRRFL